ncbi:MAG: hypothetical protein ACJ768_04675 [Gaiellaceae bacterium]
MISAADPKLVTGEASEGQALLKGVGLSMKVSQVATGGYGHAVVWKQKASAGSIVDVGSDVFVTIGPVPHG